MAWKATEASRWHENTLGKRVAIQKNPILTGRVAAIKGNVGWIIPSFDINQYANEAEEITKQKLASRNEYLFFHVSDLCKAHHVTENIRELVCSFPNPFTRFASIKNKGPLPDLTTLSEVRFGLYSDLKGLGAETIMESKIIRIPIQHALAREILGHEQIIADMQTYSGTSMRVYEWMSYDDLFEDVLLLEIHGDPFRISLAIFFFLSHIQAYLKYAMTTATRTTGSLAPEAREQAINAALATSLALRIRESAESAGPTADEIYRDVNGTECTDLNTPQSISGDFAAAGYGDPKGLFTPFAAVCRAECDTIDDVMSMHSFNDFNYPEIGIESDPAYMELSPVHRALNEHYSTLENDEASTAKGKRVHFGGEDLWQNQEIVQDNLNKDILTTVTIEEEIVDNIADVPKDFSMYEDNWDFSINMGEETIIPEDSSLPINPESILKSNLTLNDAASLMSGTVKPCGNAMNYNNHIYNHWNVQNGIPGSNEFLNRRMGLGNLMLSGTMARATKFPENDDTKYSSDSEVDEKKEVLTSTAFYSPHNPTAKLRNNPYNPSSNKVNKKFHAVPSSPILNNEPRQDAIILTREDSGITLSNGTWRGTSLLEPTNKEDAVAIVYSRAEMQPVCAYVLNDNTVKYESSRAHAIAAKAINEGRVGLSLDILVPSEQIDNLDIALLEKEADVAISQGNLVIVPIPCKCVRLGGSPADIAVACMSITSCIG